MNQIISNLRLSKPDEDRILTERSFNRIKNFLDSGGTWEQLTKRFTPHDLARVVVMFYEREQPQKPYIEAEFSEFQILS